LDAGLRLGIVSRFLRKRAVSRDPADTPQVTDWVSGASMMVRSRVFADIGLLDEGYFLYFEEVDFCLRARRAGWTCWYVPASRVVHLVGRSTGFTNTRSQARRRPSYWFESRRRYFRKNHGPFYAICADAAWVTGFALWRLRRIVQGKPDQDPPHMLWDFLRHNLRAARSVQADSRRSLDHRQRATR
jgi:GT2 family glycosyltransferase